MEERKRKMDIRDRERIKRVQKEMNEKSIELKGLSEAKEEIMLLAQEKKEAVIMEKKVKYVENKMKAKARLLVIEEGKKVEKELKIKERREEEEKRAMKLRRLKEADERKRESLIAVINKKKDRVERVKVKMEHDKKLMKELREVKVKFAQTARQRKKMADDYHTDRLRERVEKDTLRCKQISKGKNHLRNVRDVMIYSSNRSKYYVMDKIERLKHKGTFTTKKMHQVAEEANDVFMDLLPDDVKEMLFSGEEEGDSQRNTMMIIEDENNQTHSQSNKLDIPLPKAPSTSDPYPSAPTHYTPPMTTGGSTEHDKYSAKESRKRRRKQERREKRKGGASFIVQLEKEIEDDHRPISSCSERRSEFGTRMGSPPLDGRFSIQSPDKNLSSPISHLINMKQDNSHLLFSSKGTLGSLSTRSLETAHKYETSTIADEILEKGINTKPSRLLPKSGDGKPSSSPGQSNDSDKQEEGNQDSNEQLSGEEERRRMRAMQEVETLRMSQQEELMKVSRRLLIEFFSKIQLHSVIIHRQFK